MCDIIQQVRFENFLKELPHGKRVLKIVQIILKIRNSLEIYCSKRNDRIENEARDIVVRETQKVLFFEFEDEFTKFYSS